jgi:hypothetical protein
MSGRKIDEYRGYAIIDFGPYLLLGEPDDPDYIQQPFYSIAEAKNYVDREIAEAYTNAETRYFPTEEELYVFRKESTEIALIARSEHSAWEDLVKYTGTNENWHLARVEPKEWMARYKTMAGMCY